MSLKAFHIFFIGISIVLGATMTLWGIYDYFSLNSRTGLLLIVTGLVLFVLLIPYIRWFRLKMRRLAPALLPPLAVVLSSDSAWACAVCYGNPSSPLIHGAKSGVLFLIFVIAGILAAILGIGLAWARRAKALSQ
jgi:hypothetical protein